MRRVRLFIGGLLCLGAALLPGGAQTTGAGPAFALRFATPAPNAVLEKPEASLELELESAAPLPAGTAVGWALDETPLRWLDLSAFEAQPQPGGRWRYHALQSADGLSLGGHTARAAAVAGLARPQPLAGTLAVAHFYVGREDFKNYIGPGQAHLLLLSPGTGRVDLAAGEPLPLCFAVSGTGPGNTPVRLRYRLDALPAVLVSGPGPVLLRGVAPGRHELTAELIDATDRPLQGNFTFARRVFEVRTAQAAQAVGPQEHWWDDTVTPDLQREPRRAQPVQESEDDGDAPQD